jgi:hypothetical protein
MNDFATSVGSDAKEVPLIKLTDSKLFQPLKQSPLGYPTIQNIQLQSLVYMRCDPLYRAVLSKQQI